MYDVFKALAYAKFEAIDLIGMMIPSAPLTCGRIFKQIGFRPVHAKGMRFAKLVTFAWYCVFMIDGGGKHVKPEEIIKWVEQDDMELASLLPKLRKMRVPDYLREAIIEANAPIVMRACQLWDEIHAAHKQLLQLLFEAKRFSLDNL